MIDFMQLFLQSILATPLNNIYIYVQYVSVYILTKYIGLEDHARLQHAWSHRGMPVTQTMIALGVTIP